MEALRQTPALLHVTRRLYARTWGAGGAAFRAPNAPKRPGLAFYVRLPGSEPLGLLDSQPWQPLGCWTRTLGNLWAVGLATLATFG
eukprot:4370758-Prymnesium_polylepis.1